jgi:hypothetical protein
LITITGTDDHVRPEPVITFHRIERSSSTGIRDHFRPEHALPMTQTQIGDYLGLTVVHINRVLRALRHAQIVTLEKHCVTIHDLELLKSLAENGETVNSRTIVGERSLTEIALQAAKDQSGWSRLACFPVGAGVERET